MKCATISFKARADVELTIEEIDLLLNCSAAHYDYSCRAAGREGGFLFGINNMCRVINGGTSATRSMSFREVDTLCKILEVRPSLKVPHDKARGILRQQLHNVLTRLNELATLSAEGTERR